MFYVIESATTKGGTAKTVTSKDDIRSAQMLYFQILASMTANDDVIEGFCTVLDRDGRQRLDLTTYYQKPIEIKPEDIVDVTNG